MGFEIQKTDLDDAYLISDFYVADVRGSFTKIFEKDIYADSGIDFRLNETFYSCSDKNVIRGLHFQTQKPQSKMVSVIAGRAWDVIIDLRPRSKTFKKWQAFELSVDNHLTLFVPKGFAHGFVSLEDGTIMLYQCDGKYDRESDTGIIFDDPDIGIAWPIEEKVAIHSDRDLKLMSFKEYMRHPMES